MALVLDMEARVPVARVPQDYSLSTKCRNPPPLPQTIPTMPSTQQPALQADMLALTGHRADPIRVPACRKPPNLVRTISLVAISPDPRAYLDMTFLVVMKFQPSPFLRVDQAVSNIEECPGSLSAFLCHIPYGD